MKKEIAFTLIIVFFLTLASAAISLEQQPKQTYNFEDTLDLPIKIIASQEISDVLLIKLICGSIETEIYKEYISLTEGEKTRDLSIPLIASFIGNSQGTCSINYQLGTQKENLSQDFDLSSQIDILAQEVEGSFSPGDKITLSGTAIKRNGKELTGIIEANFSTNGISNMIYSNLVENGNFIIEIILPQNIKAGDHTLNLFAYEKNSDLKIINNGSLKTTINVKQIASNIEIILDDPKLDPGETLKGRIILHDQTGENMIEKAYIAIKDSKGQVIEKIEKLTDEYFEHDVNLTEAPSTWRINVYAGGLDGTSAFIINEKKAIKTEILNNTLTITNIGNVNYEEIVEINIGEEIKQIDLSLKIGESKKFTLTAPRGNYLIQIGEESKTVSLTGKSVDVKKFSEKTFALKPAIWIFIIIILGLIAYMIFRKGYKRTFFGRKHPSKGKHQKVKDTFIRRSKKVKEIKGHLINPLTPVEFSLSIHGNKQTSNIINLHLKNYSEISSGQGGVVETLKKITELIEESKGLVYQSRENLFLIFSPEKTRTFKIQELTISLAKEIVKILENHNKLFKQKIEYGLAIDEGELIIKSEKNSVKFTAITALMTNLKRMSIVSNKQIFLSEKLRNTLASKIKVDKVENDKIKAYNLKEIVSKPDHSKFITGFMERLGREDKNHKKSSK